MLWNASAIKGYAIAASDGRLGSVNDFLFDDTSWMVRWLVVDTGNWLSGRKVLLPPLVMGHPHLTEHEFPVRLTKQQIKDSPDINADQPVSRQMETELYDYYGWYPYWGSGLYMGGYGYMGGFGYMGGALDGPPSPETRRRQQHIADTQRNDDDPHLRSIAAVSGYHIHASDGEVGHVEDFLLDDTDWSIHYLVVDTKNWWPGKKVLISPRSARKIDWKSRLVNLDVDRDKVKGSSTYGETTMVDRAYEAHFHSYYRDDSPGGPDRASV
jgi:sporulation protein YlmC with PRC-barrel domain